MPATSLRMPVTLEAAEKDPIRSGRSAGAAGGQTSAYWTGNGYGTAQVNLRGLGINRTLTLINGRRVVNGAPAPTARPTST